MPQIIEAEWPNVNNGSYNVLSPSQRQAII